MAVREVDAFGNVVRSYRRALGLTQEELAERAGLSERAIRDMERGPKHVPRKETVQLLADALQLGGAEREAFQLAARRTHLPGQLVPLQSLDQDPVTYPTNLPHDPTPFIGRQGEIAQLLALLQRPTVRLVTLTGPGGIGKTRLALQAAGHLREAFSDGVYVVSLASLNDPSLVPTAIALTLGIEERAGQRLLDTLTAFLQTKQLLLLLDNYEHLLPAAEVVSHLLAASTQLQILITSRAVLHLAAEHEYLVPPLTVPDPAHLPDLEALAQYDAIALFLERAQAVKPTFTLTEPNAGVVAELCYRLEGLPLAIELAAPRLRLLPPQSLLERLSQRLHLLTGGARDRPTRHQTLRGAIDWSYSLLEVAEQRLFARLSVFAGGWTLEAAERVCNPDGELGIDMLDGMTSLVEQSLVRQQGKEEPRFLMLETIREYTAERLAESGTGERLKRQHARYFLRLAEEAAPRLQGPDRLQGLSRLGEEHDNLEAALSWAQERGEIELGLRLAVSLSQYWEIRGYLAEGKRWLIGLLPTAETGPPSLRAAALLAAGILATSMGNSEEATDLLERSLVLYRQLGDTKGRTEALDRFAYQSFMWRDGPQWIPALEEHLAWGREVGDRLLVATALHWLAWLAAWQCDARRARALGEESLGLFRDLGDPKGTVDALLVLMQAAYGEGDVRAARAWGEAVTARLPRLNLDASTRERMQFVAYRARDWGDYGYAMRLLDGAVAQALEVGDRRNAAYARATLALFARERGEYGRATALYQESLAVFEEIGDRWGRCAALLGLGDVARDQGEAEGVTTLCQRALDLGREIGSPMQMGFALHNLALAARAQAEYPRAEALLDESLAVFCGPPECRGEFLCSRGLVALDQGQYDRAEEAFIESLLTARTAVERWRVGTLLEGLAGVAVGRAQPERAAQLFGAADALRATIGTPIWPVNRPHYERDVAEARAALGEERLEVLWEEGRAMTTEQAISYALGDRADP